MTNHNNKYNAKGFWYCAESKHVSDRKESERYEYYASRWEYAVHQELLKWISPEMIHRQYKVTIKPATSNYPAMFLAIDFAVITKPPLYGFNNPVRMLVEAKGMILNDFKVRLKLLEHLSPVLYKTIVVVKNGEHGQVIDCSRLRTYNLETLKNAIDKLVPLPTK